MFGARCTWLKRIFVRFVYKILYCICQIAPVLVSQSLLERMRNNFMVVEIWDKKTNAENDKVGYQVS